jgi:uncharacterized protein (TIGR03437 family)
MDAGNWVFLRVLAADNAGNLFAVSEINDLAGRSVTMRVIKMDRNGAPVASFDFGAPGHVGATANDEQGNLVIAGTVNSSTLPLIPPLSPSLTGDTFFVAKLDPQLRGILFSTLIGRASPNAIALDSAGNIYIAGTTSASDYPLTSDAYQTKPPAHDFFGTATYAFLTEISPNGDRILYSTYFGGDRVACVGRSSCIGAFGYTSPAALAIDPSGAVVMAGVSSAQDLPVTGAVVGVSWRTPCGFISRFSTGGARKLEFSTFVNSQGDPLQPSVRITAMALDPTGNVVVGGTAPNDFPTTAGVLQPKLGRAGYANGFIAKVSRSGSSLIWATFVGQQTLGSGVNALTVDSQARITVTGYALPGSLPTFPGSSQLGASYVARLTSDGTALDGLYIGPNNSVGQTLVLTSAGNFIAAGFPGSFWIETSTNGPSLLASANAAGGPVSGRIAPYELISLYGIGPQSALAGQIEKGAFTTSLGGYRVLFDGVAAPLLYVGPNQINTVVPGAVFKRRSAYLQIVTPAGIIDGPTLVVRIAEPYIFQNSQTGLTAALNQDGSLNTRENPAKPGSIVTIFATGGETSQWLDGQLVPPQSVRGAIFPVSILTALANPHSLAILYAGDAPGLVAGVMQVNFRLPDSLPPGKTFGFQLQVGETLGGGGSIAVTP